MKHGRTQNFFYKLFHDSEFPDAIYAKNLTRLKILCEKYKNFINCYYVGRTPLQDCILFQFNAGAIELLKNGANPNLSCKSFLNKSTLEDALTRSSPNISLIRLLGFYGAEPPSTNNYFKSQEIKEAYWQGRNVFLKNEPIAKLIELENNLIFKTHYIEIFNLKICISSSQLAMQHTVTETTPLLNQQVLSFK